MKKILIMSLLATVLLSNNVDVNATKNPQVYSALGDVIYDNVDNILKLKNIDAFKSFSEKINSYSTNVQKTKDIGYDIESGSKRVNQLTYLNSLRTLSKENDYFLRSVRSAYKLSIEKEDSVLFSKTVNSGLINTDKYKNEIIEYYFTHSEDINASGVIQSYLDEDSNTKVKAMSYAKMKKLRQEAKIKRIRAEDKKKQAQLEKSLQEEVKQKKIEIRENQKRELFN